MSAHIAIRCDECGKIKTGPWMAMFHDFRDKITKAGWECNSTIDFCRFCVARRKAKKQAEEAAAE